MISIRPVTDIDIASIHEWPPYPVDFADHGYALRENGRLTEYRRKPYTGIRFAGDGRGIAGFSIIARKQGGGAEFRVALHPGRLGQGTGEMIARLTLAYGFADDSVRTIFLTGRKNHPQGRKLYEKLQFVHTGECIEEIQVRPVEFLRMEIDRDTFRRGEDR